MTHGVGQGLVELVVALAQDLVLVFWGYQDSRMSEIVSRRKLSPNGSTSTSSRPMLIDMSRVYRQSNLENLDQAFTVAERDLGVTRLLDPEDVDVAQPDEKSIITYVSSLYDAMPRVPEVQDGVKANELQLRWQEYYEVVTGLLQWSRQHSTLFEERRLPASYEEIEEQKEQLAELGTQLGGLARRARTIVQLKPRSPGTPLQGRPPIQAVCDYKQMELPRVSPWCPAVLSPPCVPPGEQDESLCKSYISQLKDIRLQLESCESRTVHRLRLPLDADPLRECAQRQAEQQQTHLELEGIQKNLAKVSEKTEQVLAQPEQAGSAPVLRSELEVTLRKMEQVYSLSSIYLEKLKTIGLVIRSTQGAEELLRKYEEQLKDVQAVPADLAELEASKAEL
ncbi:plectin-like, partial [Manacus vitellinus]|uniref:plectin-like n=1 Tax=Manacus vitellinus TaxID=328815 RepID=UPI00115E0E44